MSLGPARDVCSMSSVSRDALRAAPARTPEEVDRLYRYWRVRVMYAMTTGYALYYFTRKNISMAAKPIADEFGFTNTQWGLVLSVRRSSMPCRSFSAALWEIG